MAPQPAVTSLHANSRIGIVNRGEAALRFIRGVREYNSRFGTSLAAVAIYTAAEEQAPFVKNADDRVCFEDLPGFPGSASSPYLDHELILSALEVGECDALWVGWGFVSEDAPFAARTEERGLTFLGPDSRAMGLLGDKIAAKALAEGSDVPILPWSRGAVGSLEEAVKVSESIGYPVIVKASNAGGGRGIRFVLTPQELAAQYASAVDETLRITGTRTVFIEHLVRRGRHLEVQVLADRHGNVNTFGVRDCSLQRRNQKIIEETPPPGLARPTIEAMEAAAARLIKAAEYTGAGTVEYLYDLDSDDYYFMEVNTRLQVEHPITEELYGIDLVTGQIEVAFGRKVDLSDALPRGHVMEARLNAEDPGRDFSPAPGPVALFRPPAGPGIRVDSGIETGAEIPSAFDSMVAKIIARGRDRTEAIARLRRALDECAIRIENGTTNRAFLRQLLDREEIVAGAVSTAYVGELLSRGLYRGPDETLRAALVTGAVTIARERFEEGKVNFHNELATLGKPRTMPKGRGQEIALSINGTAYTFTVYHVGGEIYHLGTEENFLVCRYRCRDNEGVLDFNGDRHRFILVQRGDALQCEVNGIPFLLEQESRGFVKSPSPAIVLSVPVKAGDKVARGSILMVLEAMKMEMLIEAPAEGVVAELLAGPGSQVAAGQSLLRLEEAAEGENPAVEPEARVEFTVTELNEVEQWQRIEREIQALFLGFDTGDEPQALTERLRALFDGSAASPGRLGKLTTEALENLCAVETLFSSREIENEDGARPHTYTELLAHYALRQKDREKGLPNLFTETIERALAAYRRAGVSEETDTLLYHIYRSHAGQKAKTLVARELVQLLEERGDIAGVSHDFPKLVNEVVRLVHSWDDKLADAVLHARYTLIDREQLSEQRNRQRHSIDELARDMSRDALSSQDQRIDAFLDLPPSALTDLLRVQQAAEGIEAVAVAELIARYLHRDRLPVTTTPLEGGAYVGTRVRFSGNNGSGEGIVLIATNGAPGNTLPDILPGTEAPAEREITLLVTGEDDPERRISEIPPVECRFLAFGIYPAEGAPRWRTFLPAETGWVPYEEVFTFSPLEYRELRVERLRDFNLKLISRTESVTVLEGRAKANEKDIRLFALASTSETDPELSSRKNLTRMIRFERVFMEAVYAVRAAQQGYRFRLQWNRIIIYNRSLLGLRLKQLRDFGLNLVPRTIGLGLEKMVVYTRRKRWREETVREHELIFHNLTSEQFSLRSRRPSAIPLTTLDSYGTRVVRARQRGQIYPYELIKMITHADFPSMTGSPGVSSRSSISNSFRQANPDQSRSRVVPRAAMKAISSSAGSATTTRSAEFPSSGY